MNSHNDVRSGSFDLLPSEIAGQVCNFLKQSEVSHLSLARRSFYQLIRPILYRHPVITTYASLILFSRTISKATYMGKVDRKWSEKESLNQTRTLSITIDPTKNDGQPPPAVMISRTIQAIVRRCPNIAITVCFSHCRCRLSPVSALETETFPGVKKLVIYVGKHDPEDSQSNHRENETCHPNARFWRPFVNGVTFPDCLDLELRHYWTSAPPSHASLDLMRLYPVYNSANGYHSPADLATLGSTNGLKKFESIVLEAPPELNPPLLMQLLGNPSAVASNLTNLELRFANLDYETYSKLLYHMPPKVKRLVLLCCDEHIRNHRWVKSEHSIHLCPLVREFHRKLVHLEFGASAICRDLFFNDAEKQSLKHNGIKTRIGIDGGATDIQSGNIDRHAIRETIEVCRKQKRMRYRNDRIKKAISAARAQHTSESSTTSLFGGHNKTNTSNQAAARAQRDTEAVLDQEEEARRRLISRGQWTRRFIAYRGLCNPNKTWEEMQVAAEMEEEGIETVLVCKRRHLTSQHSNGKPPIVGFGMDEALREKYQFRGRSIND